MDAAFNVSPAAGGAPAAQPYVKAATPTAGQTVTLDNTSADHTLYLTPAGVLATLTVSLPSDASSTLGQTVTVASTQTLTLLTVNGATILNNITTLVGNAAASFRKVAANTWVKL